MTITKLLLALLLWMLAFGAAAAEQESTPVAEAPPAPVAQGTQYSEKGADTCLMCHTVAWPYPIFDIFKTKHAQRADKRTPFAAGGLQCEACHGPGAAHAATGNKGAINSNKPDSWVPVEQRNAYCLKCHSGNARTGWHASTHGTNDIACANCHKIHAERDPVRVKATQPEVCYKCHTKQRADFHKSSVHPVRFGTIACSDCHNPHGTNTTALLVKPTVNQTCYTCHAEKRGPFLWEHAPAAEDCTLCHTPHGSVYGSLLKKNPPLLCQQCHSVSGHPAVARTPAGLPGGSAGASGFLLVGGCTNCHSQVHGSNHPSGVKLMR